VAQKWAYPSIGGPTFRKQKGGFFLTALISGILWVFEERHKSPVNKCISPHRGPVRKPGGVHLLGFLREKEKYV